VSSSSSNGDTAETSVLRPAPPPAAEAPTAPQSPPPPLTSKTKIKDEGTVDLRRRRDQLNARVAELQWDLGGLVYEMAIRNRIRVEVLVQRAAVLQ
jgi:hypothetical protein